jgi:hypothetical protein
MLTRKVTRKKILEGTVMGIILRFVNEGNLYDENDSAKGQFRVWRMRESMLSIILNPEKHTMLRSCVKKFSATKSKILLFGEVPARCFMGTLSLRESIDFYWDLGY